MHTVVPVPRRGTEPELGGDAGEQRRGLVVLAVDPAQLDAGAFAGAAVVGPEELAGCVATPCDPETIRRRDEARQARAAWQADVAALGAAETALAAARDAAAAAGEWATTAREHLAALRAEQAALGPFLDGLGSAPPPPGVDASGPGALVADLEAARSAETDAHARLTALVREHRARLETAAAPEPTELREAVAEYESACTDETDQGAVLLAQRWVELEQQLAALAEAEPGPASWAEIEAAEQRVTQAARRLSAVEEAARGGSVSPARRAEIEAAHQALLEAEQAGGGRHGRKRVEAAEQHLATVLGRAGFDSLLDYRVSSHTIDPADEQGLFAAQHDLRRAQSDLRALQTRGAASEERHEIEGERRSVLRQATALLGFEPAGRVGDILRDHPKVPAGVNRRLVDALAGVGVTPTDRGAWSTAIGWLAGWEEAQLIRRRLDGRLAAAEQRLAAHEAAVDPETWDLVLAHARAVAEQLSALTDGRIDGARLRGALTQAEAVLAERAAEGDEAAARAAEEVEAADAELSRIEDGFDPILGPDWEEDALDRHLRVLADEERAADEAVASQRHRSVAGAVEELAPGTGPVVLLDPWKDVDDDLLTAIDELARTRLVVYATARPGLLSRLTGVGVAAEADDEQPAGEEPATDHPAYRGPANPAAAAARRAARSRHQAGGKRRRR